MARLTSMSFALLAIVVAAMVSLGCAENTSSEAEYSAVVAALEGDPAPDGDIPPPYVPIEPSPIILEEPVLPPEPLWIVEGVGTHFEVSGGGYLDVALTSSEPIQVQLESVPSVITMNVESAEGATSTQITLSGLEPTTTYYKYTDGYENLEELVTDETGTCAYIQDLGDSHHVFIQTTPSTIFLTTDGWSDPSVGTWDPATLTGTLIRDVSETIYINRSDGITLDGAGFAVSGSGSYGIYAYVSPNATIKNVNVHGFSYGLHISASDNVTIESVNVHALSQGIFVNRSYGALITDSTISASSWGVQLYLNGGHTVSGNTISTQGDFPQFEIGVRLYQTSDNIVSGNTVSTGGAGIYLLWSPGGAYYPPNTISDNNVNGGRNHSINVYASVGTKVTGNTIYNPNAYGGEAIYVWGASDDTTVRSNEVSSSSIFFYGDGRYIQGCTVDNNMLRGARLRIELAENCTVTNNTLDYASMWLDSVRDSTVADNAQWHAGDGIYVSGYSYRIKFERNTASDNSRTGITMTHTTGIMELTDNVAERNGTDGIVLYGPFNNALTGNLVADNGQSGLWLVNASDTPVLNTTALNNLVGIQLDGANNTEVSGSTVSGNDVGIYLYDYAQNNQVRDNRVSDNEWGIYFYYGSDYNTVLNNTVCLSTVYSLGLQRSRENTIYNNDFTTNAGQVRADYGYNYLSADLPAGGNYWSDLGDSTGHSDDDGDGVYDQPFYAWIQPGYGNAIDYYPLVSPLFEPCVVDDEGPVTSNVTVDPSVVQVGGTVTLTALVDDTSTGGSSIASAEYSIEGGAWLPMMPFDGAFDSPAEDVVAYITASLTAGVYEVCVRGTDALDNVGEPECTFLVAYDPDGGFVTGGGWIDSPEGAYAPDPTLTGKANFGFVSKYKKGASVPTGNTEFQFKVADLNFKSTSYDWLVIAGDTARYKGEGTINGEGTYKFMLWGGDGTPDTFRIRIWTEVEETAVETDIYDNGFDQELGGGSVVLHKAK